LEQHNGTEMVCDCLAMIALPQCMSKIMHERNVLLYVKHMGKCLDDYGISEQRQAVVETLNQLIM
jgi:hypothetical protein